MTLGRDRARQLITTFADRRICVIGDLMLDRYIYGAVRRISPEAPVPVVNVTHEKCMPGGASNVAWNIQTLGGQGQAAGVVGDDEAGHTLRDLLETHHVNVEPIITDTHIRTTVKTRIIAERQQIVRVDWEDSFALTDSVLNRLCEEVARTIAQADGVIIEDYGKGVIQQQVVNAALAAARDKGIPVGYDPKDDHALDVRGITVATPNRKEAYAAVGREEPIRDLPPLDDADLREIGTRLLDKWGMPMLAITLGPQGMILFEQEGDPIHVPTRAREVFDVSGAGDTVIATSTLALASGASPREAVELANYAAGVVVAQLGTAPCTAAELIGSIG